MDHISKGTANLPPRYFSWRKTEESLSSIGVTTCGYGAEKVSYGLPVPGFSYRRTYKVPLHRIARVGTFWQFTPVILDRSLRGLHTFNDIPVSGHNFLVSFENELPRYLGSVSGWQMKFGCNLLASDKCRHIMALSDIAAKLARERFCELGFEEINKKISVFRGGIHFSEQQEDKVLSSSTAPIKALFVGCDAISKGIIPTLQAINRCRESGVNIELTIVSRMLIRKNYALKDFSPSLDTVYEEIDSSSFITLHKGLPNPMVRKLMRKSDVLLFPSYDESLGFVVIEAGLEGTPTIANNIFAIPELIDDEVNGFLIQQELGKQNRWIGIWQKGEELRASIEKSNSIIVEKICDVLSRASIDRTLLIKTGAAMRKKMEMMYDREAAARRLSTLYRAL